jgi:hypothetical protein
MPYIGKSNDGFGIRERFFYLATSGDTTVSGTDTRGVSLVFTDPEYVDVFLNGTRLKLNEDYNLNTANTVSGLAALSENDEVEVIVYDVFSLADMVSANTGGTFNNNITVDGDLTVNDDLSLLSDASVLNFGADSEIKLTHVADTGLLLTDSGGTPTLQLHDSNESVSSDGSKIIITSGGTAFSLPTADGSANQVLATDGSGTLSFFDALAASAVSTFGGTLIDDADASTARATLGLGTAATTASTDYATAAQGTLADSALQDVVDDTTPQLGGDLDTNGNSVDFGASGWSIALSGTNLVFSYNGTAKIKFASDGEIVTVDDVTAFGTI